MDYSKHNTKKQRKKIRSNAAKSKKKIGFNIFRFSIIAVLIVVIIGIAAVIGGFKGVIDSAPEINVSDVMPSKVKSVMYYPDGTQAIELVGEQANRTIVSIDEVAKHVPEAFIAIEDERFYEHNGIDPKGIVRALFVGLTSHDFSQGASTITQQLIKLTVFNGGAETDTIQRFKRKFQEWYLALELEKELNKDEIMEAYLNTINLGCGAYGVESAAERYFNKKSSELTISEAAVIAAIAQSPTYNNPVYHPDVNAERRDKILNNMLNQGYITQAEYDEAMADNVYDRVEEVNETFNDTTVVYSWFEDAAIDAVINDLQKKLGYTRDEAYSTLYSGGLQIYLTQNRYLQSIVDSYYLDDSNFTSTEYRMNWQLNYLDKDGNQVNIDENTLQNYYGSDNCDLLYDTKEQAKLSIAEFKEGNGIKEEDVIAENLDLVVQAQSSFVLMDQSTGYVLALTGGRGEKTTSRSLNRATGTTRQPGSVFKPIAVFLPGLDSCGLTLASTKEDEPYETPDGSPVYNTNANSYRGTSTVRQAITNSMNIVSVKWLLEDVTIPLAFQYLKDLGITTIDETNDAFYSLALGGISNGVSNLELTAAYAAIANGGVYTEPILYSKILDQNGNVLIDNVPEKRTVMKDSTAWLLTSAMEDVVNKGTGTAAKMSNYGIAQAGKTGTTNEWRDLWFVGYTPYYTAGIWLGYDDNISMRGRINYSYIEHKTLWKNIMDEVHQGLEDRDFVMPDSVEKATVCEISGLLASGRGCDPVTEYFAKDSHPEEYCSSHIPVTICSECGLRATDDTPDEYVTTRYYNSYSSIPSSYCEHKAAPETEPPAEDPDNPDNPTPTDPDTPTTPDPGDTPDDGGNAEDNGDEG